MLLGHLYVFFGEMSIFLIRLFAFFFNDTATTEIYTLSLHDALPISGEGVEKRELSCTVSGNVN